MNLCKRKTEILQLEDTLKVTQCLIIEHILLVYSRWDKQSVVDVVIEVVPRNTVALRHLPDLHVFAVNWLPSFPLLFPSLAKKLSILNTFC